jgi:methyltransferase-like protein/protein-L-isoaspartate O-methyltransferase
MLDPNIEKLRQSYTEVPYNSQAYSNSHPDRLATLGRIFNLPPASVENCRVLELGCASGGNIIPMAYFLPESEFVGIELNEGHVKSAQKAASDLAVKNIQIQQGNILDVDTSLGVFDYIICHGVFSWVPESVQNKILSIASENLAENGIAYISFNTYPGWHMREMIRHMMLYHSNQFDSPVERIGQARAFVDFLAGAVGENANDPYVSLLSNELEALKSSGDWYVFHDYMEVVNKPIYFHEFIDRADKCDLQYLADANFSMMFHDDFSNEINNTLEQLSHDIVQKEQYMDFLRNRQFRQTLLCKKGRNLKRMLDEEDLTGLLVLSSITPENGTIDLSPGQIQKFRVPDGKLIETQNTFIKIAFKILRQHWPKAIAYEALLDSCIKELGEFSSKEISDKQEWKKELGRGLLNCFVSGAIDLRSWQGTYSDIVSIRPKVSDLTLYQVSNRQSVVNQHHETVNMDPLALHLLPLLDGTNTKDDMINQMVLLAEKKTFTIYQYDLPVNDLKMIRQSISQSVDNILAALADATLLIA